MKWRARFSPSLFAFAAVLLVGSSARADGRLAVRLEQTEGWRYNLVLTSQESQDVITDRRLLELRVKPEGTRRSFRCRHPRAPRSSSFVRAMAAGEHYEEWVDLRMYCSGNALRALRAGNANVELRYGYARRRRGRFVARREGERRPPARVDGESFLWQRTPTEATDAPLRVGLIDHASRGEGGVRFRPTVRAGQSATPYVYFRDDQFIFDVRKPDGTVVHCERPRARITPIVDRYRRLSTRRRRFNLEASYYCPDDTFDQHGVYEVTPILVLPHAGPVRGHDALTGRFVGSTGVVRVTGDYAPRREGAGGAE